MHGFWATFVFIDWNAPLASGGAFYAYGSRTLRIIRQRLRIAGALICDGVEIIV
jgi:hypothetical protein